MIKYLTQPEVKKRAKHKIAEIGSVFAPTQPRPSDPKGQSPNKSKDTTVTVIIQNN